MRSKSKVVALIAAFVVAFAAPVFAYPPGQPETSTLTADLILAKSGKTVLNVAHAKPGATITIKVGKGKPIAAVAKDGVYSLRLKGLAAGIYLIATTTPTYVGQPDEVSTVTLYVPSIRAPKVGKITAKTKVIIKYIKPGTVVTIKPTAGKKKKKTIKVKVGAKATRATIVIPAKTFAKGKNNYKITIGKLVVGTFTFKGK